MMVLFEISAGEDFSCLCLKARSGTEADFSPTVRSKHGQGVSLNAFTDCGVSDNGAFAEIGEKEM